MSASHPLHRRLSDKTQRLAMIAGAVVSWILIALLYRFATSRALVFTAILIGPCVLLLNYFAFGGDIPLKLRQKGYRKLVLVPVVFWISFVIAFVVIQFGHFSLE